MGKNKVVYAGQTVIDLTGDTVTAATMLSGTTAHDRSGTQITGTYTPPASGATVKTTTATPSSSSTTISFTGLSAEPKMFSVEVGQQMSLSSTRYVVAVHSSGTSTYGLYCYTSGNSRYVSYSASYFTWTYSSGTLQVKTSSSSNGGSFRSGYSYRLIYAY